MYFFLELSGYSLLLPIFAVFVRGDAWILLALIVVVIIAIRIRNSFTKSLRIDGVQLEVIYTKYFIKRIRHFKMADTILVLRDFYDLEMEGRYYSRQSWFSRIEIIENNKVRYIFSTKEGYTKETILEFFDVFTREKNRILSARP